MPFILHLYLCALCQLVGEIETHWRRKSKDICTNVSRQSPALKKLHDKVKYELATNIVCQWAKTMIWCCTKPNQTLSKVWTMDPSKTKRNWTVKLWKKIKLTNSYKVINAALKSTQNIVDQVSWKMFFTQFFSCYLFIAHCGSTSSVSVDKLVKHILDKFSTLQFVTNSLLVNCVLLIVRTNFFSQNFFLLCRVLKMPQLLIAVCLF
jgi:hypothetical protein